MAVSESEAITSASKIEVSDFEMSALDCQIAVQESKVAFWESGTAASDSEWVRKR